MTENTPISPFLLGALKSCKERMDALNLKGKKRDHEALTYFAAYCTALQDAGIPDFFIPTGMVFILSIRDYSEVTRSLARHENAATHPHPVKALQDALQVALDALTPSRNQTETDAADAINAALAPFAVKTREG